MTDSERKQNIYLGMQGIIAENFPGWEIIANVTEDGTPQNKSDMDIRNLGVFYNNKIVKRFDETGATAEDFSFDLAYNTFKAMLEHNRKQHSEAKK